MKKLVHSKIFGRLPAGRACRASGTRGGESHPVRRRWQESSEKVQEAPLSSDAPARCGSWAACSDTHVCPRSPRNVPLRLAAQGPRCPLCLARLRVSRVTHHHRSLPILSFACVPDTMCSPAGTLHARLAYTACGSNFNSVPAMKGDQLQLRISQPPMTDVEA